MTALRLLIVFLLLFAFGCGGKTAKITSHYNRGIDFLDKGLYHHAADEFKEELVKNSSNLKAKYNLALAYHLAKDPQAEAHYSELFNNHKNIYAGINLARIYEEKGDSDKAIKILEKALELHDYAYFTHFALGDIYYKRYRNNGKANDLVLAEKNIRKSIELNKDFTESHFILGTIEEIHGKHESAYQHFQTTIKNHDKLGFQKTQWPEDFNTENYDINLIRYLMKTALLGERLNKNHNSIKQLERAISQSVSIKTIKEKYDPEHLNPLYRIGKLYFKKGNTKRAVEYLLEASKIEPENKTIKTLLKKAYKKSLSE